jgi:catechol 2,3-dioxygenase-like lactoylglutathione lyase family enzyme
MIESISAVTLATYDMRRAVRFYTALGFALIYGGTVASLGVKRRSLFASIDR